jgi:hypothetical protein
MQVHPSQISPGEPFDLFYFLRNHTDGTTYYVRAIISDLRTGEVLQTVDLDQAATNARLFIKSVQAPPDSTGYGRNIVAIATVYTDSGYTTKSPDYEEQEQYYLIKSSQNFGGGGGVDYRVVRDIFSEELTKHRQSTKEPLTVADMPFQAVFGAIGALTREVGLIPKEHANTDGVTGALADLQHSIETIDIPEQADLSPVISALSDLAQSIEQLRTDLRQIGPALLSDQQIALQKLGTGLTQQCIAALQDHMGKQELTIPLDKLFKQKPEQSPETAPDLSHLMA